jgi:hypothetical protein
VPFSNLAGFKWRLEDLIGDAVYERDGDDLQSRGLFLDEPGWSVLVFLMTRRS